MFDDDFANAELLMRQTAMAALEQFTLILILVIAGLTALARNVVRLHHRSPNTLSPRASL